MKKFFSRKTSENHEISEASGTSNSQKSSDSLSKHRYWNYNVLDPRQADEISALTDESLRREDASLQDRSQIATEARLFSLKPNSGRMKDLSTQNLERKEAPKQIQYESLSATQRLEMLEANSQFHGLLPEQIMKIKQTREHIGDLEGSIEFHEALYVELVRAKEDQKIYVERIDKLLFEKNNNWKGVQKKLEEEIKEFRDLINQYSEKLTTLHSLQRSLGALTQEAKDIYQEIMDTRADGSLSFEQRIEAREVYEKLRKAKQTKIKERIREINEIRQGEQKIETIIKSIELLTNRKNDYYDDTQDIQKTKSILDSFSQRDTAWMQVLEEFHPEFLSFNRQTLFQSGFNFDEINGIEPENKYIPVKIDSISETITLNEKENYQMDVVRNWQKNPVLEVRMFTGIESPSLGTEQSLEDAARRGEELFGKAKRSTFDRERADKIWHKRYLPTTEQGSGIWPIPPKYFLSSSLKRLFPSADGFIDIKTKVGPERTCYLNYYNPSEGKIILFNNFKDSDQEINLEGTEPLPNSQIIFFQNEVARQKLGIEGNDHRLTEFIMHNVSTPETRAIVFSAMQKDLTKTFEKRDRNFYALLSTANCRRVIYFLEQHKNIFANKEIATIDIEILEDGSNTDQKGQINIRIHIGDSTRFHMQK